MMTNKGHRRRKHQTFILLSTAHLPSKHGNDSLSYLLVIKSAALLDSFSNLVRSVMNMVNSPNNSNAHKYATCKENVSSYVCVHVNVDA